GRELRRRTSVPCSQGPPRGFMDGRPSPHPAMPTSRTRRTNARASAPRGRHERHRGPGNLATLRQTERWKRLMDESPRHVRTPLVDDDVVLSAPLFADMEGEETRALFESMVPVELVRGDVLFREGEPGDRLYVIAQGKIKLGRRSSDGRENLLSILGPGEMFGELSLFDPGPRTASASSVSDSVVYELRHESLVRWIADHPGVATTLLGALARRLRRTNE